MKYQQLIVGIVVGLFVGFMVRIVVPRQAAPNGERYVIHQVTWQTGGEVYRAVKLDKASGETWGLGQNGWKRVPETNVSNSNKVGNVPWLDFQPTKGSSVCLTVNMRVFISHNKADKTAAHLLAIELALQGVGVWFDEWKIKIGDSIVGGIEEGLSSADVFVLMWSANAEKSKWVGTELRAYLHRRVSDENLRIIPIMLDDIPLPALVADYRGKKVEGDDSFAKIAEQISGVTVDKEFVRRLQNRFLEITSEYPSNDPLPYVVCPECGSVSLTRFSQSNEYGNYYCIKCEDCKWQDGGEV
jgi:hypothetical protein